MKQTGCVWLVGAGCGTADLITLRGLQRLCSCEVLVYDDLIDPELLAMVPRTAERIYMGKRSGRHSAPQEEISATLVRKALEGKRVVRLKGGDPFVFGRGGEEILALQAAGIPYEEVPGISSCIAVPASVGIPVTHRLLSRGFHVITGHTADTEDCLPPEMDALARVGGTLVFLMGLKQLPRIADRLIGAGMTDTTPAAVISGSDPALPRAVRAPLCDIADAVEAAGLTSPAVIVIGETAALDLAPTIPHPLAGCRIALTGTDAVATRLAEGLRAEGADAFRVERSVVDELSIEYDLHRLTDGRPHLVVLTSSNGVRILMKRLAEQRIDLRALHSCRFAVIGATTGETLASYGLYAELCPEVYTSRSLGALLVEKRLPDEDVLILRSVRGSAELSEALRAAAIPFEDIPTYDLHAEAPDESLRKRLQNADYLTFSSSSGVSLFMQLYGALPERSTCVCIGEVTAAALSRVTDRPFLTADEISSEGIIRAITAHRARMEDR